MVDVLRSTFPGSSAAASMLRELDWAGSPVGPPTAWPSAVRATVALVLTSSEPALVCWRGVPLANDAWQAGRSPLDPRAGVPPEIAAAIAPLFDDPRWLELGPCTLPGLGRASPLLDDREQLVGIAIRRDAVAAALHRIREPLAPVLMTLDLMQHRPEIDGFPILDRQIRQMVSVIDDISQRPQSTHGAGLPDPRLDRSRRVLIVEDDDMTARALEAALSALGHEVAVAHDGPVAVVVAREFQPEVVLLDIGLPVLDGWDLSARLRELGIPARIIAVTARATEEDLRRSSSCGFAGHLVKPVDMHELRRAIAED